MIEHSPLLCEVRTDILEGRGGAAINGYEDRDGWRLPSRDLVQHRLFVKVHIELIES